MASVKLPRLPRWTIGAKLVFLIASLLLTSVVGVGLITSNIMVQNDTGLIQTANLNAASILALEMREVLLSATDKMRTLGATLIQESILPDVRSRIISEFFSSDRDFLAVYVQGVDAAGAPKLITSATSPDLLKLSDGDGKKLLKTIVENPGFQLTELGRGEHQLISIQLPDSKAPALVIGVRFASTDTSRVTTIPTPGPVPNSMKGFTGPLSTVQGKAILAKASAQQGDPGHVIIAVIRQTRIAEAFSKADGASVFLVDRHSKLLARGETGKASIGDSLAGLEIVKMLREAKSPNGQKRDYIDPTTGEPQIGAYATVGFAGLGVVAQMPAQTAFEGTNQVKYESGLVAVIILFLSFLAGFLYSGTITKPIRRLVEAAGRISGGDFKIDLPVPGRDEISQLSGAFNDMAKGLEERDRVKETFNKFHNREIAEKLLSGEVKLGGERKLATVLFTDIRGFTGLSESMSPEQVVEMLNEYMTRMVRIIRAHGGVVDKYIGDSIMALWGVPIGRPEDTEASLRACLEMRRELAHLNAVRIQRGHPALKIGMGLNYGEVVAGNIGSEEKMEYTVIGDTVNLASRIEAMTKEFGTDILVSQTVIDQVGTKFIHELAGKATAKGKSVPIEVHRITGYLDQKGESITVETPYSTYAPEPGAKVARIAPEQPPMHPPVHAPEPEFDPGTGPIVRAARAAALRLTRPVPPPPPPAARAPIEVSLEAPIEPSFVASPPPPAEAPLVSYVEPEENTNFILTDAPNLATTEFKEEEPTHEFSGPVQAALDSAWFVKVANEVKGPLSSLDITNGLVSGTLHPEHLMSTSSEGPWKRIDGYPQFADSRSGEVA